MKTISKTTMLVAGALLGCTLVSKADKLADWPVSFKLTAQSQGEITETDTNIKFVINKSRVTNKDILGLLNMDQKSKIVVRLSDGMETDVMVITPGGDEIDVCDQLADFLLIDQIGFGGEKEMLIKGKEKWNADDTKGSGKTTHLGVWDGIEALITDPEDLAADPQSDIGPVTTLLTIKAIDKWDDSTHTAKVTYSQAGEVTGTGVYRENFTEGWETESDFILTGTWLFNGKVTFDTDIVN